MGDRSRDGVDNVSERMIWVVRLIGIIIFLVLMYLLMSLHSRLVKMNEEGGASSPPASTSRLPGDLVFSDPQRV